MMKTSYSLLSILGLIFLGFANLQAQVSTIKCPMFNADYSGYGIKLIAENDKNFYMLSSKRTKVNLYQAAITGLDYSGKKIFTKQIEGVTNKINSLFGVSLHFIGNDLFLFYCKSNKDDNNYKLFAQKINPTTGVDIGVAQTIYSISGIIPDVVPESFSVSFSPDKNSLLFEGLFATTENRRKLEIAIFDTKFNTTFKYSKAIEVDSKIPFSNSNITFDNKSNFAFILRAIEPIATPQYVVSGNGISNKVNFKPFTDYAEPILDLAFKFSSSGKLVAIGTLKGKSLGEKIFLPYSETGKIDYQPTKGVFIGKFNVENGEISNIKSKLLTSSQITALIENPKLLSTELEIYNSMIFEKENGDFLVLFSTAGGINVYITLFDSNFEVKNETIIAKNFLHDLVYRGNANKANFMPLNVITTSNGLYLILDTFCNDALFNLNRQKAPITSVTTGQSKIYDLTNFKNKTVIVKLSDELAVEAKEFESYSFSAQSGLQTVFNNKIISIRLDEVNLYNPYILLVK